jgi:5,10-methylenetetrahydromethanopterin reductase
MRHELSIAFQTDKSPDEYIALAKQVNQYNFDVVTVYCDAPFHPSYGPLLLMAPHIDRARIGSAAVSPSRIHPIDIAAETALLAQLAKGGVYIGVARGAWLETYGINEIHPPIQGVRETVEIIRYLLEGRSGGYQGQVFQLAEHARAPYPLPKERIPLLIGTWGKKMCALAGELADEVKVGGSANPDVIPFIQDQIRIGEEQAGREVGTVAVAIGAVSVVDENRDLARSLARREVALYLPVVADLDPTVELDPELVKQLRYHADRYEYDDTGRLISDDLLDRFVLSGNVEDVVRQSAALFDAGASRIEFGTPHGLESSEGIRLIGEKVLPALKELFPGSIDLV